MFEHLFKSERALARHRDAPLAEERARYIQHCIERGSTPLTIELKCKELLWAARLIQAEHRLAFNKECLHALAVRRSVGQRGDPVLIQERFENIVRPWLRYLGWWEHPVAPDPCRDKREAYCMDEIGSWALRFHHLVFGSMRPKISCLVQEHRSSLARP